MSFLFWSTLCSLFSIVTSRAAFLRDRPRGLGLLQLPTGMTDERSGPFFPNLYIAGDKAGEKPAAVPDVHLPGQMAVFSGRSAFNPFTHAVAATFNEDLVDSWGHMDLPIPGVYELFDLDGRIMLKGGGNGILNSALEFPLTLSDPNERAPYTFKYLNFMADRHMQYGHVVPNVNLFLVGKDKIMDRLSRNTLNPTMIG
ncbi:hypothetical protein ANCCAN_22459 [Ancylostoma caninum]|uniref:Uncharacterized protein n=1 Tax=Ancylostoma caninum TaxID=29170 RepID=A0A368FNI8_ANCCA|nr:hypothetical protein ANCCAN_22459 [Ancylostoma caninum]